MEGYLKPPQSSLCRFLVFCFVFLDACLCSGCKQKNGGQDTVALPALGNRLQEWYLLPPPPHIPEKMTDYQ